MLKLLVTYPNPQEEREILDRMSTTRPVHLIDPVMDAAAINEGRRLVDEIYIDEKIKDYIVSLVMATRDPAGARIPVEGLIHYGGSPRATIYLTLGAKAMAFLAGRGYVVPQDVKDIALDVLRHRIILTYEAEAEERTSDDVVRTILEHVPVP
jgi:MoxR-like ATPase